ncbi:MAG: hypothetical protein V4760_06990 [Bdellovibrionota bacterium]
MIKRNALVVFAIALLLSSVLVFQNCAKAKFMEPEGGMVGAMAFNYCVNGMTRSCSDATGTGLTCEKFKDDVPAVFRENVCIKESCNSGYMLNDMMCIPVACQPGTVGACIVDHGVGSMTCHPSGSGFGACNATTCDSGYTLLGGLCIGLGASPTPTPSPTPVEPTPTPTPGPSATPTPTPTPSPTPLPSPTPGLCTAGSHRDCGNASQSGFETCNDSEDGYGACELKGCNANYHANGHACDPNTCEPNQITFCSQGAGSGFKTCNSAGSAWGACVFNLCQSGYTLKDGVCAVQSCSPGSKTQCEYGHGVGEKTCNSDGLDYGTCVFVACNVGYTFEDPLCIENVCSPGSSISCQDGSGYGTKTCHNNGKGYGNCNITTCAEGFVMRGNSCVSESYCETSDVLTCPVNNGSGVRSCDNHAKGPCRATSCDAGYELKTEGNAVICKKKK